MAMNLIKTMHLKQALINNLGKNNDFGIKSLIRKLLNFYIGFEQFYYYHTKLIKFNIA